MVIEANRESTARGRTLEDALREPIVANLQTL